MTSALFILVPLSPRVIGGVPIPATHVQMVFELIVPEIGIAILVGTTLVAQKLSPLTQLQLQLQLQL